MNFSNKTKFYIALNFCLVASCIVFSSFYNKASKKAKDASGEEQKNQHKQMKLWGWLAVSIFIIILLVNWRTCLFLMMVIITFMNLSSP